MADIQKYFEDFHATIRLDYEASEPLRSSRDVVLNKISAALKKNKRPAFKTLLQGSYKMKTGVKPIGEMEYDIDVGLRFEIDPDEVTAAEARSWVLEAVEGHTKSQEDKGPCIRVVYQAGYHLDLVTYATPDGNQGEFHLAHKTKGWRAADPQKLLDHVNTSRSAFANTTDNKTKTDQFRRCIRYLRRWNDVRIPTEANHKPSGLALVLAGTTYGLSPQVDIEGRPNDLASLKHLVAQLADTAGRIRADKPSPEYEDMFARLSDKQMDDLKEAFSDLRDALVEAEETADPSKACEALKPYFGDDFPSPPPDETAKKTAAPAIVTSVSSA